MSSGQLPVFNRAVNLRTSLTMASRLGISTRVRELPPFDDGDVEVQLHALRFAKEPDSEKRARRASPYNKDPIAVVQAPGWCGMC